ncbi:MAG: hypothetical protein JRJ84_02045 [Deltaproteobacteria bacterium]|nr:hypothetical protein [Deltaproteobacteria bacterium]
MAGTTLRRLGARALFAATAFAIAQPAWALTCEEIISMVGFNIPTHIVVQTMEGSGTRFTPDDIRCLVDQGAPDEIVETAKTMAMEAEPEPEPTTIYRPEPEPEEPEPDSLGILERAEALGTTGEVDDVREFDEEAGPQRLEELIRLYRSKKLLTSSKGLYDLLQDGLYPEHEAKIQYYLAKSLYDLGMYHGAQQYFMQVVRKGPGNPYFKYALPKLVAIAQLTGNDTELLRVVHKIPPEAFPRQAKNHLYYLMGRKLYDADELSASARYFQQISPRSDLFMRSKYFEGVIHNERGKLKSAVKAFRDVYQADLEAHDERTRRELLDLKELSLVNIARIYYGLERFETSDEFYSLVDRESSYWPQSLFERAWAQFMMNDLNGTLGLILTTNSPYYRDHEYLPEATVLRALTFFQLCQYDEVEDLLLDFEATYRPMRDEMRHFLDQYTTSEGQKLADQAFETYFEQSHEGSDLRRSFFLRLLRNRDLSALVRHMDLMDEELAMIDAQKPAWRDSLGSQLKEVIEHDRRRYKKRAGLTLLHDMADEYANLGRLLSDSEIIRFEVVDAQRLDYEYKMQNPLVESDASRKIDYATSGNVIYWPFNGEFWRDELGFYHYAETPTCQ